MKIKILYVGLDVHKKTTDVAIASGRSNGKVRSYGKIDSTLDALNKLIKKLQDDDKQLRFVYEAGPCGYQIYRHLDAKGIPCSVVAPSMIPPGEVVIGSKPTAAMRSTWRGCFVPVN